MFIQTYTGQIIDLQYPEAATINITDIAVHLSRINRFVGATSEPYTVAQHSVYVARLLYGKGLTKHYLLAGLLHDAHEAYIGDISYPMKQLIKTHAPDALKTVSARLDAAITERFNLPADALRHPEIKKADLQALAAERRDLMTPDPTTWPVLNGVEPGPTVPQPLKAAAAQGLFIETFAELCGTSSQEEAA